jgi:hypothetical protein
MIKTLRCSSKVSSSVVPLKERDRGWATQGHGPEGGDPTPSLPVSRSMHVSLEQFESCWQPSKNYQGGLVKEYSNLSSELKPQKDEWKSPTLSCILKRPPWNLSLIQSQRWWGKSCWSKLSRGPESPDWQCLRIWQTSQMNVKSEEGDMNNVSKPTFGTD